MVRAAASVPGPPGGLVFLGAQRPIGHRVRSELATGRRVLGASAQGPGPAEGSGRCLGRAGHARQLPDGFHPHRPARPLLAATVCGCAAPRSRHQAGAPGRARLLDHDASAAGTACRGAAPGHLAQDLRVRLRPVSAGVVRQGLGAAPFQADDRPVRARCLSSRCAASIPPPMRPRPRRPSRRCSPTSSECWRLARDAFRCPVIQQTVLPVFQPLLGSNEHRLPGSRHRVTRASTPRCATWRRGRRRSPGARRPRARATASRAGTIPPCGIAPSRRSAPPAAPLYGDLVGRLLAAKQGRSFKCLVLDLDNTLWGGVIGDDGLEGIMLGQGSALRRGLRRFPGLCARARQARRHPRRVLEERRGQRARAVRAAPRNAAQAQRHRLLRRQLEDKAPTSAPSPQELNIGLDSLVFVDDNPFERNLVRAGTAHGRRARIAGRSRTCAAPSPTPAISRRLPSPPRIASAPSNIRPTASATR